MIGELFEITKQTHLQALVGYQMVEYKERIKSWGVVTSTLYVFIEKVHLS